MTSVVHTCQLSESSSGESLPMSDNIHWPWRTLAQCRNVRTTGLDRTTDEGPTRTTGLNIVSVSAQIKCYQHIIHTCWHEVRHNALKNWRLASLFCCMEIKQSVRETATICPRPCDLDLWPFNLESGVLVTCDVGYLYANFSLPRPLCSRLRPDVRDRRQTDLRQTDVR